MCKKILSFFLLSAVLLVGSTTNTYAQFDRYEIKKVCFGPGNYAAVVEYNQQHFVIVSREVILRNYVITDMFGLIQSGGVTSMRYFHNNSRGEMNVRVLSRFRWGYSGYPGARTVCRSVASRGW